MPMHRRHFALTLAATLVAAPALAADERAKPDNAQIGIVKNLRDELPVKAVRGGTVLEWLVEDGDPVSPGQPLLRLYPSPDEGEVHGA